MIDIHNETLISIREAPRHLPRRQTGKRVHISAVYRWLKRGVRGVCLESVSIGGTTYTSKEALQRFADRLSNPGRGPTSATTSTTATRKRQIENATRQVESILGCEHSRKLAD